MARQAEADRERRARVINADAELQASKKLARGRAGRCPTQPAALQLRLLQTVVAVAAEKNSTLVLPFPVELLRFLDRGHRDVPDSVTGAEGASEEEAEEEAEEAQEVEAGTVPPELADLTSDTLPPGLATEPRLSVEEAVEDDGGAPEPRPASGPEKDT